MITKTEMARIIVQAIRNLPELPPADHFEVVRRAKRPAADLTASHKLACKVLAKKVEAQS